jgi:hypothetical protein
MDGMNCYGIGANLLTWGVEQCLCLNQSRWGCWSSRDVAIGVARCGQLPALNRDCV